MRRRHGFTLVEVAVALWILTVALLTGIALVLQQPRVVRRIDAERQAVQVVEWTIEEMRAGLIPLQTTANVGWPPSALAANSAARNLRVSVAVVPTASAGLFSVLVVARYEVYGQPHRRQVETMIWRQGG